MTDFTNDLRFRCRNPKCRCKLPTPVSNEREAFCNRGCHNAFYRRRCRVCECPIEQPKRGTRLVCNKAKCKTAWRAQPCVGCPPGHPPTYVLRKSISEVPVNTGVKTPLKPDRGWRIVAGPPLTPNQLHCATIPDGPDGWEGGEYRRLEAKETAAIKAAEIDAFTDPDWRQVSSPDGVRCFVRDEASVPQQTMPALPDDLSI